MSTADHLHADYTVHVEQASVAGIKANNEDCIGLRLPSAPLITYKGIAAVIADGVSAAEKGKEAAESAVQGFLSDYYSSPDSWSVKTAGQKVLTALNRWLYGQGQHFASQYQGYACTFSALIVKSRSAYIFHVGDTRIYRWRGNVLEPLTTDHAARINKNTSYLLRALGVEMFVDIDYRQVEVEEGDVFFLSTDGLHNFVSAKDIEACLQRFLKGERGVCDALIQQALANQSDDNLSCQILHVEQLPRHADVNSYRTLVERPFPPPLSSGQKLDGYRIEQQIHASARSQLYLVSDLEEPTQRLIMKTPSVNFEDDLAYIERFVLEAWIAQRIDSPHVVKFVAPRRSPQFLFNLMEYHEGPTLESWMRTHRQADVTLVVNIAAQLMKGLRAFHRRDTLHQDLKPANIVLEQGEKVIIVDFGSCFVAGIDEIAAPLARDKILGTASYTAPEYHCNVRPDARSDQFSLGMIVYEMLTGQRPYGEKYDECMQLSDFLRLPYTPAYHHNPLVPVWMDGAIKKAVNMNLSLRYDDIAEFIHDLQRPNPEFITSSAAPFIDRNPLLFWKLSTAVLAVLLLLSWAYFLH